MKKSGGGHNLLPLAPYGVMAHGALVKLPDCGTCSVIWGDNERGMEHVSVSPRKKLRVPTWNDMCVLKDIFFGCEEEVYQIHPKASEYVNIRENCLHLWKPIGHDLGEPGRNERDIQTLPAGGV